MMKSTLNRKSTFFLVVSLFFLWGFLTVLVDSLIPRLKEVFELSYFEAGLIQFAFFIAYGLASIPSGDLLQRIGYKKGIVRALTVMGLGCLIFILAASVRWYLLFLIGLFVLAWGMTILQVAANPYIYSLGSKRNSSSRLNIAQGFNSIGTTIAPLIGAVHLLGRNLKTPEQITQLNAIAQTAYIDKEAGAVQEPFLILGLSILVLALIFRFLKLPESKKSEDGLAENQKLLKNKGLRLGMIGIFIYVGCEVSIGSYLVHYFLDLNLAETIRSNPQLNSLSSMLLGTRIDRLDNKAIVGAFVAFYWGGAMVGRFLGAFFNKVFQPSGVLSVFGFGAIAMLFVSILNGGLISMWSILAVGLFNSIMFPTIFALSIENVEEQNRPQASGLLCTAIVGGAIIPPFFGLLIDIVDFKYALFLIILGYTYIAGFANWKLNKFKQADKPATDPARLRSPKNKISLGMQSPR